MAKTQMTGAVRTLSLELKKLEEEPVEGFLVKTNNDNLFHWQVAIFGPPNTLYEGGYFKAEINFPFDYPYSPPTFRFITKMWHPNIYDSGDVCISILHPPVDDPQSGELPSERWNPTQSVRLIYKNIYDKTPYFNYLFHDFAQCGLPPQTILLSVISLLNEPNTFSPANVDASVMYRKWKESKGKEADYEKMIKKQVLASKSEATKDGVTVPTTLKDYCIKTKVQTPSNSSVDQDLLYEDFAYDDEYDDDDVDDDDEDYQCNEDDSGNEES